MNGLVWMDNREEEDSGSPSWPRNPNINSSSSNENNNCAVVGNRDDVGPLLSLKSMLGVEDDWYMTNHNIPSHSDMRDTTFPPNLHDQDNLLLHPVDSSSSCSPSSSVFNHLDPSQIQYLLPPPKPPSYSLHSAAPSNPLDQGFDLGSEVRFLDGQASNSSAMLNRGGGVLGGFTDLSSNNQISLPNLCSEPQLPMTRLLPLPESNAADFAGFPSFNDCSAKPLLLNRPNMFKPLESSPSLGSKPTLYQKRAALRKISVENGSDAGLSRLESRLGRNGLDENEDEQCRR